MDDIYSLFLNKEEIKNKPAEDSAVNSDKIVVSFPAWGSATTLVYNKETKILDVTTRWHKARYDFNNNIGEISIDNEEVKPATIEDIIRETKLDKNKETVAFLKRHGIDVVFSPDLWNNEPIEDLGQDADKVYTALKSIFKDKNEKGNRQEYLNDVLEYAQSWSKDEYDKLISKLIHNFPKIIGRYIINDPDHVFLVTHQSLGILEPEDLRQFSSKVIERAKNIKDPSALGRYVNKYMKIAKILSSYGDEELETSLKDIWAKGVLPDDDNLSTPKSVLSYLVEHPELSADEAGKYILKHYEEIEQDDRAYTILRGLCKRNPEVIKYLNPFDQKVEFQEAAYENNKTVVKYIYLISKDLAERAVKNNPSCIIDIIKPVDWRKFHPSIISKSDDNWMGPASRIKGTTPVKLSDRELQDLRNLAISLDPQAVLQLPNPTDYELDTAFGKLRNKTDIMQMYKDIRQSGIKVTPYIDHVIEQYLDA